MMRQINGVQPLRAVASELAKSKDQALARRAAGSVLVAGDEGNLLIDEEGNVRNKEGDEVEVAEEEEDKHAKAIAALTKEHRADNAQMRATVHELRKGQEACQLMLQNLQLHMAFLTGTGPYAQHQGSSGSPDQPRRPDASSMSTLAGGELRRRRTRQPKRGTQVNADDRQAVVGETDSFLQRSGTRRGRGDANAEPERQRSSELVALAWGQPSGLSC